MRKFPATVAITCAALGSALAFATPAHAAADGLYLAEDSFLHGELRYYGNSRSGIGGFSDEASSLFNDSTSAWVVYDDKNYKDRRYCIRPGERVNNLHWASWKFGDKISSIRRLNSDSCAGYGPFYL
jgi:hypothetical protein